MRRSVGDVFAALRAEGLAADDALDPARAALRPELQDDMPWFLRVAVGIGAWTATGFLMGFLLAIGGLDDELLRAVVGLAVTGAAVWAHRRSTTEFARQAAIAASLAGQGLFLVGFHELFDSVRTAAIVIALLSVVMIRVVPDGVHRFLSAIAALVATYVAVLDSQTPRGFEIVTFALIALASYVWRGRLRERNERLFAMLAPVGYALVTAIFVALLIGTTTRFNRTMGAGMELTLGPATTAGIMVAFAALVRQILLEQRAPVAKGVGFTAIGGVIAVGLTTLSSPGIIAGAAVLTLAFDRRDKVLLGIGIIFLLAFTSVFYYSLDLTLLEKAGILAASGALIVAIRQRVATA